MQRVLKTCVQSNTTDSLMKGHHRRQHDECMKAKRNNFFLACCNFTESQHNLGHPDNNTVQGITVG